METLATRVILIVEDDYIIARQLARRFTAAGAEVLGPVPNVARALRLIAEIPHIDGAVLDVNLKGEMVYPVADALAARDVPFLFMTGYTANALPALRRVHDLPQARDRRGSCEGAPSTGTITSRRGSAFRALMQARRRRVR